MILLLIPPVVLYYFTYKTADLELSLNGMLGWSPLAAGASPLLILSELESEPESELESEFDSSQTS